MASAKTAKTVSLDIELLKQVEQTRGTASTSERLNELLWQGLEAERLQKLHEEAEQFFAVDHDPAGRGAFQSATIRSWSRE